MQQEPSVVEWQSYNGDRPKAAHDIMLHSGLVLVCYWPNANAWLPFSCVRDDMMKRYEDDDIKAIRLSDVHPVSHDVDQMKEYWTKMMCHSIHSIDGGKEKRYSVKNMPECMIAGIDLSDSESVGVEATYINGQLSSVTKLPNGVFAKGSHDDPNSPDYLPEIVS
jgi:hypothetical protein